MVVCYSNSSSSSYWLAPLLAVLQIFASEDFALDTARVVSEGGGVGVGVGADDQVGADVGVADGGSVGVLHSLGGRLDDGVCALVCARYPGGVVAVGEMTGLR